MQNEIQIFKHDEFGKLEMLMIDGKPYFPAKECAEILGYSKARNAIERHCPHALKRGVGVETGKKADGSPSVQTVEKTFIPEGNLYRLIIRSKLPEAIRFEAWVCDTVLPSIRKYGGYVTDNALDQLINNPEAATKFFTALKEERDKKTELESYVEKLEPKARYYDIVLQCPEAVQVSIIAKDYGYSAMKFNKLLHALGFQYKIGKTWLLYREYDSEGYTVTRTYQINETVTAVHTCFTQKGRYFIYKMLKNIGILPLAERANEKQN